MGRAQLVLDCGHSCAWAVPLFDARVVAHGVRRVDVGGHLLDSVLREAVSQRHVDVRGEAALVTAMRERACFVAADFERELRRDSGALRRLYALPAGDAQLVPLALERIAVPELLLRPSDIGLEQAGIAESAVHAIEACPAHLAPELYAAITLVGGVALTAGLRERVEADIRALAPDDVQVNVTLAADPVNAAWHGAALCAHQPFYERMRVTKAEYDERGAGHLLLERRELKTL